MSSEVNTLPRPRFSLEAGPLMLWCWAKSEFETDSNIHRALAMWLNDVVGTSEHIPAIGLSLLLADHDATKDVVSKCCLSLKSKHVPLVGIHLVDVMVIAGQVASCCDQSTFDALCHLWPELVAGLARACERQLCSGPKDYHQTVLSHAISSMLYVSYKNYCLCTLMLP